MNPSYFRSIRDLCYFLPFFSLCCFPLAGEASDKEIIREASGSYEGILNGSTVFDDDVDSLDDIDASTRMPRRKGSFTSTFTFGPQFEGAFEFEGRITKIKVRGKKVRYRGVLKYPVPFLPEGEESQLVGLLNATSKRKRSGWVLTYPVAITRLLEADDIEGLDQDYLIAFLLNFKGEK